MRPGVYAAEMSDGITSNSVRWFHEIKVDGAIAFRAGRQGDAMVADWPGLGTLTCARDGTSASFSPVEGVGEKAIGKLERAQVRGLLRDLAGQLAVHSSAVDLGGRGVLFLGADGAGKSTAAAEMCVHHGALLLADDAASLQVDGSSVTLLPSELDHWLTPASRVALGIPHPDGAADEKRELRAARVAAAPVRLALTIALRFDPLASQVVVRRPRGSEGARWLLEAAIRFDVEDGAARRRELEQLMTVYQTAPFLEVVRPSRAPHGVAAQVLDALKQEVR
jgi:hypothetical protein